MGDRLEETGRTFKDEYYMLKDRHETLKKIHGQVMCESHEVRIENEILKAKLEIVYLIFGNKRGKTE